MNKEQSDTAAAILFNDIAKRREALRKYKKDSDSSEEENDFD
jgi:hypothetical protein